MLNTLLSQVDYKGFWTTLDSDDLYADLIADVSGFEELMRVRIAVAVGQCCRSVERDVLEGWLNLSGGEFDRFVGEVCGWGLDTEGMVLVPVNKENEAKGTVVREEVRFDRELTTFFSSLYRFYPARSGCLQNGFGSQGANPIDFNRIRQSSPTGIRATCLIP